MRRVPGTFADYSGDGERTAVLGFRVIEAEVVDQFLGSHGVFRRRLTVSQEAPHVRVRRSVYIRRKRRQRMLANRVPLIVVDSVVSLGIERRPAMRDVSVGCSRQS